MSDVINAVPAVTGTADDAPAPTVTRYQQLASEISAQVKAAFARIPSLEESHPLTKKLVKLHALVPTQFIATATTAVESSPELTGVQTLNPVETRDTLQFLEAFLPFFDEMTALTRNLKFTLDSRKTKGVLASLRLYAIAKGVARDDSATNVAAHVQNMKRDLNKKGGTKKKAPSTQPQTPTHS